MSGPFIKADYTAEPTWTTGSVPATTFSRFPTVDLGSGEVGYGEGGYGEDGYDAPATSPTPAATPVWTVETTR